MKINRLNAKSDIIGASASMLCLLHCLATPFLFVWYSGITAIREASFWWWGMLDLVFLIISFLAVYWSAKTTSKFWVKLVLWISWGFLSLAIINEKLSILPFGEMTVYIPTISLIFFHIYNRRYCKHSDNSCAVPK